MQPPSDSKPWDVRTAASPPLVVSGSLRFEVPHPRDVALLILTGWRWTRHHQRTHHSQPPVTPNQCVRSGKCLPCPSARPFYAPVQHPFDQPTRPCGCVRSKVGAPSPKTRPRPTPPRLGTAAPPAGLDRAQPDRNPGPPPARPQPARARAGGLPGAVQPAAHHAGEDGLAQDAA